MRKLVDAPRKKKQWTEKEEAYLQDKWGTVSIKGLSKALGRSENAIIVRARGLRIPGNQKHKRKRHPERQRADGWRRVPGAGAGSK